MESSAKGVASKISELNDIVLHDEFKCEQMVVILEEQIGHMTSALKAIDDARSFYLSRLEELRGGVDRLPVPRAANGSVNEEVLKYLQGVPHGATAAEIVSHVASVLPRFNRRSVQTTLGRMKASGMVRNERRRWTLVQEA